MPDDAYRGPCRFQRAHPMEKLCFTALCGVPWRTGRPVGVCRQGDHDHREAELPELAHAVGQLIVAGARDDDHALPESSPLPEHDLPEVTNPVGSCGGEE